MSGLGPLEPSKIAVIGASGWIGQALLHAVAQGPHRIVALSRRRPAVLPADAQWSQLSHRPSMTEIASALCGIDAIINVAGAAHQPDMAGTNEESFANEHLPRLIAEAAVQVSASRLVHLSSIKALAEGGSAPLRASDEPRPTTAYGRSKLAGERATAEATSSVPHVETTILRVPLVYGVGAGANFVRLARLASSWLPVPLPTPAPHRALVYLGNLTSLLVHLAMADSVRGIVHAADLPHLTTREIVSRIATASGKPDVVVPVPVLLARPLARCLGAAEDVERLTEDLVVEPTAGTDLAGWSAPYPAHSGLDLMRGDNAHW